MISLKRESGSLVTLDRKLGGGGEGEIFTVIGKPRLAAKIYDKRKLTPEHGEKLRSMLAKLPSDPTRQQGHISIAWPTDRLSDRYGNCVGFLMPYIDHGKDFPLFKLYNQPDRLQTWPGFTWKYLLHTAVNLASVVAALHSSGYVIGDLKESNIYVSNTALVTLVDCDSMQVPRGNGQVFRCPVGSPEYTPPELQGKDFRQVNRAVYHDDFGLAVLIFLLLMEGIHPFDISLQGVVGTPPTRPENIKKGNFPYGGTARSTPRRSSLPFEILPPELQKLMVRCFVDGHRFPQWRPTAHEWLKALSDAEQQLTFCQVNRQHWYSRHLTSCPWCIRMRSMRISDPFPPGRRQMVTPPMSMRPVRQVLPPKPAYTAPAQVPTKPVGTAVPSGKKGVRPFLIGLVIVLVIALSFFSINTFLTIPQLKSLYGGRLQGIHSFNIHLFVDSQDQNGNITGRMRFDNYPYSSSQAIGSCKGTVARLRHIHLSCHDFCGNHTFTHNGACQLDTYEGDILLNGSIKGMTAFQNGDTYNWDMTEMSDKAHQTTATVQAASQNPYPHNGKLVIVDPLHDNSRGYSWDEYIGASSTCNFATGAYHISVPETNHGLICTASATNFSDFTYQVQMTIIKGDGGGGIAFRFNSFEGYEFYIRRDGSYVFEKIYKGAGVELKTDSSPAIKTGINQANLLAIVAKG